MATTSSDDAPAPATHRLSPVPVVLVVVAAAGLAVALLTRDADAGPGPRAPRFSLDPVRPADPPLTVEPGGRPVVVNFFASWCVPCRTELPVLEAAHRRAGARVSFVGVDVADSRTAAAELLVAKSVTYPTGHDPFRVVAGRYRLQGIPTTVFIGTDGRIEGQVKGPLTRAALDRWLERLRRGTDLARPRAMGKARPTSMAALTVTAHPTRREAQG